MIFWNWLHVTGLGRIGEPLDDVKTGGLTTRHNYFDRQTPILGAHCAYLFRGHPCRGVVNNLLVDVPSADPELRGWAFLAMNQITLARLEGQQ